MSQPSTGDSEIRWRMRPARPEDAPAIAALLNDVFGNWGDAATWSWKYENLPASFRLISAVAEVDGRLVGHYGIVPLDAIHQGREVRGAQAVDAAVLPDFRRQGILSALAKRVLDAAAEQQVTLIYAFPGLYSLNLNRRIGFQPVTFVPEMVRLLDPKRFLVDRLRALPGDLRTFWRWRFRGEWSPEGIARLAHFRSSLLWMLAWLSAPAWRRRAPATGASVRELAGFDASFDRFSRSNRPNVALGLLKDCAYLSWRYIRRPDRAYRIWGAYEGEQLVAYLVVHLAAYQSNVCELEFLPGSQDAIFPLLEAAAQTARDSGSLALGIWASPHARLHAALGKAGFISPRRLHRLAARRKRLADSLYQIILYLAHLSAPAQAQIGEVIDQWSISLGDSDLV